MNISDHLDSKTFIIWGALLVVGFLGLFLLFNGANDQRKRKGVEKELGLKTPFAMRPGAVSRFQLSYKRDLTGETPGMGRNGTVKQKTFQSRFAFEGQLYLRSYRKSGGSRYFIGARLSDLVVPPTSSSSSGSERRHPIQDKLDEEIFVRVKEDGTLLDFYFPSSVSRQSIVLWQGLLDAVVPGIESSRKNWSRQHRDLFGLFTARYKMDEKNQVSRTLEQYDELTYFPNMESDDFTVQGTSEYRFSEDGKTVVNGKGTINLSGMKETEESTMKVNYEQSFTYELDNRGKRDHLLGSLLKRHNVATLEQLKNELTLFGPGEFPRRSRSSEVTSKTNLTSVVDQMENDGKSSRSRRNLRESVQKIVPGIRKNPGEAVSYIKEQILDSGTSEETRKGLIASLMLSQNVQALGVISDLLRRKNFSSRGSLIESLWMVGQPTKELTEAVKNQVQASSPQSKHFRTLLRSTGVLAARFQSSNRGKALVKEVLDKEDQLKSHKDKLGFLDALGNSRSPEAFQKGKQYLFGNTSPKVKYGAVIALQNAPDPDRSARLLLKYVREEVSGESPVMRRIVTSLVQLDRKSTSEHFPRKQVKSFLRKKMLHSKNSAVRMEALPFFIRRLGNRTNVRKILQKVVAKERNLQIKRQVKRALSQTSR